MAGAYGVGGAVIIMCRPAIRIDPVFLACVTATITVVGVAEEKLLQGTTLTAPGQQATTLSADTSIVVPPDSNVLAADMRLADEASPDAKPLTIRWYSAWHDGSYTATAMPAAMPGLGDRVQALAWAWAERGNRMST